jgi:hypothetical protein
MVNYVVALYLGKRRNGIVQDCIDLDPFYLLKSHFLSIHRYKMDGIHKVTFVVSPSENVEAESKLEEVFHQYKDLCSKKEIEYELLINPDNRHISYGSWHHGVLTGLSDERTKHFFLLEDDYVPCSDNFHHPYVSASQPDVCYVCQMWASNPDPKTAHSGRIAITNGLLNADISREIFQKHGRCFMLDSSRDYEQLLRSKTLDDVSKKYLLSGPAQKLFIRLYQESNYRVTDLGPEWQQLFLNSRGIKTYGTGNSATIRPINEYTPIDPETFYE